VSFWVLVQVFVNLVLLAGFGFVWFRLNRPAKDDPRLSRGLQLLQSKIAVLEDLSDRTEIQVTQLTSLMEQKCRDIQGYIVQAEKQVQKIESSMGKSLEVAKIFQDKIPHQEIIERQNTIKYVKAARMAHQGMSVAEIAGQVDLSQGEIEFISKVNRDQLQFSEEDLPAWAHGEAAEEEMENSERPLIEEPMTTIAAKQQEADRQVEKLHQAVNQQQSSMLESTIASQSAVQQTLSQLGDQFRNATFSSYSQNQVPQNMVEEEPPVVAAPVRQIIQPQAVVPPQIQKPPPKPINNQRDSSSGVVKKVVFPRIDGSNNWG